MNRFESLSSDLFKDVEIDQNQQLRLYGGCTCKSTATVTGKKDGSTGADTPSADADNEV